MLNTAQILFYLDLVLLRMQLIYLQLKEILEFLVLLQQQPQDFPLSAIPHLDRTLRMAVHVAECKQNDAATDGKPEVTEIRIQPGVVNARISPIRVGQGLQYRIAGRGAAG